MRRNGSFLYYLLLTTLLAAVPAMCWTKSELCEACRDMSTAFKKGLEASRRSNFGGGNTAWEESRLGAWAFSETRLVGILEGVCKDATKSATCHSLAEEQEEAIEEWWQKKYRADPENADLFQFMCVRRLKVCCPKLHYGEKCVPCLGIVKKHLSDGKTEEKACSGHGDCSGSGERSGNGTCLCDSGYEGDKCSMCADNYFSVNDSKNTSELSCEPCHEACEGGCSGLGPELCTAGCKSGWRWRNDTTGGCEDVDECVNTTTCDNAAEFCQNSPGSYSCEACDASCASCVGPLSANCTACASGYRFIAPPATPGGQGLCEDINECLKEDICPEGKTCTNLAGTHVCECPKGQEENDEGQCVPKSEQTAEESEKDPKPATDDEGKKHDEL